MVESPDGTRRICHPRGKKSQAVVGDQVLWQAAPAGQGHEGTIEKVQERRNLFYRQDEIRTKSFAANLDQVRILVAAEPEFSEHQLSRALIACEAEHITPLIVLNKADLAAPFARAWQRLAPYRAMGYTVLPLAANRPAIRLTMCLCLKWPNSCASPASTSGRVNCPSRVSKKTIRLVFPNPVK